MYICLQTFCEFVKKKTYMVLRQCCVQSNSEMPPKRCICLSSRWFNYKETETRVWHNRIGPENLPVRYGFSEVGFGIFFFLEKLNIPIRYKIKSENLKNNFLIKKYYVAFRGPIESYLKKFGLVRFFNFVSVLYNLKIKRINIKTEPNGNSQIGILKFSNQTELKISVYFEIEPIWTGADP